MRDPHFWFVMGGVIFVVAACLILRKMEHPWEGLTAKRIRMDRPLTPADYGRLYGFWAGIVATGVIGILVLSSRWWWSWAHPTVGEPLLDDRFERCRFNRSEWIVLGLILVGAGFVRGQHLDRGILRDEQDTIRFHIHGFYGKAKPSYPFEFNPATWADAAFGNRYGNNPVLMSVLAKSALEIWWKGTGIPKDRYHPVVIRLPGFLAGMASIAAIAWCLAGFSPSRVALMGAFVAAIHPLHVDFSIQARGYAFVLLGVSLALGGGVRAFKRGKWRDWAALVGGCVITLYAYLGGLFFVVPLVATVACLVFSKWRAGRSNNVEKNWLARDPVRLLVAGLIGTSLYLVVAAPTFMGFLKARESIPTTGPIDWTWWIALWTEFAAGRYIPVPVGPDGFAVSVSTAFGGWFRSQPAFWMAMVGVVAIALQGFVALWRMGDSNLRAIFVSAMVSPFLQIAVHFQLTHMVLFGYYLIYWLPPLICVFALGMDSLLHWVSSRRLDIQGDRAETRWGWMAASVVGWGLLFCTVGVGGDRTLSRRTPPTGEPTVYARSNYHWISYPEGRILKWEARLPIPPVFPDLKEVAGNTPAQSK